MWICVLVICAWCVIAVGMPLLRWRQMCKIICVSWVNILSRREFPSLLVWVSLFSAKGVLSVSAHVCKVKILFLSHMCGDVPSSGHKPRTYICAKRRWTVFACGDWRMDEMRVNMYVRSVCTTIPQTPVSLFLKQRFYCLPWFAGCIESKQVTTAVGLCVCVFFSFPLQDQPDLLLLWMFYQPYLLFLLNHMPVNLKNKFVWIFLILDFLFCMYHVYVLLYDL